MREVEAVREVRAQLPEKHALLAAGNIVTKTGTGDHALKVFPEQSDLITAAREHPRTRTSVLRVVRPGCRL
ncbi:hypothetical protein GCM10009789_41500 [Kribbella sancticallisti]|uniref:Uncharacterized protein n=1 Tax=Kribbella sancticallisti TaxID=460087 RepID=A0ABN2DTI9_9ACTN